jgi:hypothetical protein
MSHRSCIANSSTLFAALAAMLTQSCVMGQPGAEMRKGVDIVSGVRLHPSEAWKVLPQTARNVIDLVREEGGKQMERVSVSPQPRTDHAEAVRVLSEIAAESKGERSFVALCGWPALVRRARVSAAPSEAPSADGGPRPESSVEMVTVAVAVDATVVRFEGSAADGGRMLDLARTMTCPARPSADTEREVQALQKG